MSEPNSTNPTKRRANGKGSVWRRPDGRWNAAWTQSTPFGRKRRGTTKATEKEAWAALEEGLYGPTVDYVLDWGYGHLAHLEDTDTEHVYFAQLTTGGPIKIGMAKRLRTRMFALQSGCPYPLQVLYAMPEAGYKEEAALHRRFADQRLHGEWFRPAPKLRDLIAVLAGDEGTPGQQKLLACGGYYATGERW